jgi:hypothetical protein
MVFNYKPTLFGVVTLILKMYYTNFYQVKNKKQNEKNKLYR